MSVTDKGHTHATVILYPNPDYGKTASPCACDAG